jgi:hypothetical protein
MKSTRRQNNMVIEERVFSDIPPVIDASETSSVSTKLSGDSRVKRGEPKGIPHVEQRF